MTDFRTYMVVVLFALGTIACLDPIEFEVASDFSDSLVVQGKIIKGDPVSYTHLTLPTKA